MSVDTNVFIKYTKVTTDIVIFFFAKFEFKIISKTKITASDIQWGFLSSNHEYDN